MAHHGPAEFGIFPPAGVPAPSQRGFSHVHGPIIMRGFTDFGNSSACLEIFYRPPGVPIPPGHAWAAAIAARQEILLPPGAAPNARSHFSVAARPNLPAPVTGVASITRENVGGANRFVLRYNFNARLPVPNGYGPPVACVGQVMLP